MCLWFNGLEWSDPNGSKHTTIRREPPLFVIARSDSDEAIPVGEALRRECLPHGDCHGREKRGLAMTSFLSKRIQDTHQMEWVNVLDLRYVAMKMTSYIFSILALCLIRTMMARLPI